MGDFRQGNILDQLLVAIVHQNYYLLPTSILIKFIFKHFLTLFTFLIWNLIDNTNSSFV